MREENRCPWSKKFENRCCKLLSVDKRIHIVTIPVMVQMKPMIEMTARVTMDMNVIKDWLRADNFTSKQLIAVKMPV